MNDSLIKKFLKFSYGSWIGLFLGLASTMLITRLLPPDALGKASMFDLFLQIGMILTIFGTDQSFVRFFYEENESKRGALLYNFLKITMVTTMIMLVFLFIFYQQITEVIILQSNFYIILYICLRIIVTLMYKYIQLVVRIK